MMLQQHQTKLALGSDVTFMLAADASEAALHEVFRELWLATYQFEQRFSRFIPNSELSAFNRLAGAKVPISQEFRDILRVAKKLGVETDGLYNPFILPALQRAGYTKSFVEAYKDDKQEDYSKRAVVSVERLEVHDTWASIPYGTAIDLGGCGKGYLADLLADTVMPDWIQGYWLSLGGDVVGQGLDGEGQPWTVAIDGVSKWFLQTDGLRFAAATSGTNVRKGVHHRKDWHHIIDPRTLAPSHTDVATATVFGSSAVHADVLASCAVILGSARAVPYLKAHDITAAYLQKEDATMKFREQYFGQALRNGRTQKRTMEQAHA